MDELDTQLAAELAEKNAQKEAKETKGAGQEPAVEKPIIAEEGKESIKAQEAKTFDEAYVKELRGDIARYRIRARDAEAREAALYNQNVQQGQQQSYPQAGQPQEFYDPRVDDIMLQNKLSEIKADPDISEIYSEVDEEGITFEEKLLEKAVELQWPIAELDALALKMAKGKLLGKVRQKAVDETYKSISAKSQSSADRSVSSGKSVEESEIKNVDDAVKAAMKEHGVTNLSELR